MNKSRLILLVFLLASCVASMSAQTFESVQKRNPWNLSRNAAGTLKDSVSTSYAELYGKYSEGGFRDTWQASRQWSAGARTSSIRHLERISLTGSFSFDQTEGYDMCGSMFINPGYFPVDVLEFTPGRKVLQTYSLYGGIAYEVNDIWAIGAAMDFRSANLAKRKDLRHTNWKLDMNIRPGFTASLGNFTIGAAAIFNKSSETIDAKQIGTAASSYYAFFDKGLMFGTEQVWTGSGVHLDVDGVNGLPVTEYSYGAAAQMQYKGFFADVEYLHTGGKVGEKEYIWFNYSGPGFAADLQYRMNARNAEHRIGLRWNWKVQHMNENVLEKISENGVTTVINHGHNRIYSREIWGLTPEYDIITRLMEFHAGFNIGCENGLASQIYPYIHIRSLMNLSADISALFHIGRFDLGVGAGYGKGSLKEEERLASEDNAADSAPYRHEGWYERQMEYRTAPRLNARLSLRYNFKKRLYSEISGDWVHGFDLTCLTSPDRFGTVVKVGYAF